MSTNGYTTKEIVQNIETKVDKLFSKIDSLTNEYMEFKGERKVCKNIFENIGEKFIIIKEEIKEVDEKHEKKDKKNWVIITSVFVPIILGLLGIIYQLIQYKEEIKILFDTLGG